jgi:hypothetical protein
MKASAHEGCEAVKRAAAGAAIEDVSPRLVAGTSFVDPRAGCQPAGPAWVVIAAIGGDPVARSRCAARTDSLRRVRRVPGPILLIHPTVCLRGWLRWNYDTSNACSVTLRSLARYAGTDSK